ncbi:ATP-binding protein [Luteipulveratus halotolerans]|uniref:ATP-binding protein n=1 Tax=Luteipulveratus halotolerans TaxID=1631356 RepID=UPI0006835434|nr:ATP-binding protein [Luteipulveratus halotolerans]
MEREKFKVDLRGIVDILGHHLYSSEQVYLRELVQNASDAINARTRLDPQFSGGAVHITSATDDQPMTVRDNGVGLTQPQVHELMATVGGSSKRNDVTATREKFLGQFGIGILSAFLVADHIEVRTRSALTADAQTVAFSGHADGTYAVSVAEEPLEAPGTEVRIHPRPPDRHWCEKDAVPDIVARTAGLMRLNVHVDGVLLSGQPRPWEMTIEDQIAWCRREFGFDAMGIVPLQAKSQDVIGVCFVLPYTAAPGHRTGDRIYSRGLLVADSETQLLPGWAFFCRAVLDAGSLPLTASREQLQESLTLHAVRDHLGYEILRELVLVHDRAPAVYGDILRLHSSGMKALAATSTDMRDLVRSTMHYPTSQGPRTLDELVTAGGEIAYVDDTERYQAMRDIAFHSDILVVCADDPYDPDLLTRVSQDSDRATFRRVDDEAIFAFTTPADGEDRARADELAERAQTLLANGLSVHVQSFGPSERLALWWPTAAGPHTAEVVLNASNPLIRALLEHSLAPSLEQHAIHAAHLIGMLQGANPLTLSQSTQLARSVQALATHPALSASAQDQGVREPGSAVDEARTGTGRGPRE